MSSSQDVEMDQGSWVPFDPQDLVEALPGAGAQYIDALLACSRIRWGANASVGYFQDEEQSAGSSRDWCWDEDLAISAQVGGTVFVIDFQTKDGEVRAFRLERALELELQIDDA